MQTNQKQMAPIDVFSDYAVTSDGRVFDLTAGRELCQYYNDFGYKQVTLCRGRKDGTLEFKNFPVHRLVAEAFVPKPKNDGLEKELQVHHVDMNNENNDASNLVWLSSAEHMKLHAEHRSINNKQKEGKTMTLEEYTTRYGLDEKPYYTCTRLGLYLWINSNGIAPLKKWKDPDNNKYTVWQYRMTPDLQEILYEYFVEGKRYYW